MAMARFQKNRGEECFTPAQARSTIVRTLRPDPCLFTIDQPDSRLALAVDRRSDCAFGAFNQRDFLHCENVLGTDASVQPSVKLTDARGSVLTTFSPFGGSPLSMMMQLCRDGWRKARPGRQNDGAEGLGARTRRYLRPMDFPSSVLHILSKFLHSPNHSRTRHCLRDSGVNL